MVFDVPESEKAVAKKAIECFEKLVEHLHAFDRHLNILYHPFSAHETVSPESVMEHRGALIRYRKKVRENFNNVTRIALICVQHMNEFSTDKHSMELVKSFVDSMGEIAIQIDSFEKVINNMKTKDFKNNVINVIQGIKKQSNQLERLIYDRILAHINTNILATSWVDDFSRELKLKIKDKEPYIKQLYLEREKKLQQILEGNK